MCAAVDKITDNIKKTRLLRFMWWLTRDWDDERDVVLKANKLCDALRENQSLVDVSIRAWRGAPNVDMICERNLYTWQVVRKADSIPLGLWPLILERRAWDESLLYHLLTSCPHLVSPPKRISTAAFRRPNESATQNNDFTTTQFAFEDRGRCGSCHGA